MSRPNLEKAIQMCGSVQSLSKTLKKYEKVGVPKAIEIAKEASWDHDQWLTGLKTAVSNRNPVKETTITLFSHPDLRTILYEADNRIQLQKTLPLNIPLHIKAKSAEDLEYGLDNPYVLAQIVNVANFGHFKAKIQVAYHTLMDQYYDETIAPADMEAHYKPMAEKIDGIIQTEIASVVERAGATARREMGLKTHVKWRQRERWATGAIAVLGTAAAVTTAVAATTATVLSMGGTVLAAGLSIHSATKSVINTSMHLNSFYIGYQKSLDRAVSALRLMENTIPKTGEQRATGSHVGQAVGQLFVGDIAEPYKNAKRYFENADYKLGKIELKLHDMGAQISAILRESEAINRLLQTKKEEITRLTTENPEQQGHLDSLVKSIDRLSGQLAAMEASLSLMLNALSSMAEPIQTAMQQLEAVRESLVALAPTLTASGLALGVALIGGAITGALSFASKSEDLLNMRVGSINQAAETFTDVSSYVSLGFTVTVGVWDVARDKMDGVKTS